MQSRFPDAERSLKTAATIDPNNTKIQTNLGLVLAASGKPDVGARRPHLWRRGATRPGHRRPRPHPGASMGQVDEGAANRIRTWRSTSSPSLGTLPARRSANLDAAHALTNSPRPADRRDPDAPAPARHRLAGAPNVGTSRHTVVATGVPFPRTERTETASTKTRSPRRTGNRPPRPAQRIFLFAPDVSSLA